MTAVSYDRLDATAAGAVQDELVDLYTAEYAGNGRPFDAPENFRRWLSRDLTRPGFAAVTARTRAELAGFVYGYRLPADTTWWHRPVAPLPASITRETGERTFAVGELLVRPDARGRGIATRLHDALLRGRPERRAVLAAYPDNAVAAAAYRSWGWARVGQVRLSERSPVFDVYVLDPLPGEVGAR